MVVLKNRIQFKYNTDKRQGLCYFYAIANLSGDASILELPASQTDGYLNFEVNDALRNTNIAVHDIAVGHPTFAWWHGQINDWNNAGIKNSTLIPLVINQTSPRGEHAKAVLFDMCELEFYVLDSSNEFIEWWTFEEYINGNVFRRIAILLSREKREMLVLNKKDVAINKSEHF